MGVGQIGDSFLLLENLEFVEDERNCVLIVNEMKDQEQVRAIEELKRINLLHTAINDIHERSKNTISVLESGKEEINTKIEEFLWKLLRVKTLEIEEMETWLYYVMERMSTTSTILSSIKENHYEIQMLTNQMKTTMNTLTEKNISPYPTNREYEIEAYGKIQRLLSKALVTVEGLKDHLDTTMQEIMTYLSLQRQKTSADEQKASREQLQKLVNLQETLHKLEILIVAVYILEMARIIFEAFTHEHVHLFSALFIPVALISSLFINRILHRYQH
jgi:hypothetical protein